METITLRWNGPYYLDYLYRHERRLDSGIYSISRYYRGADRLLYIGKTSRDFESRILEHRKAWLDSVSGEIRVRLGTLEFEQGRQFSEQKLKDVEALLIQWHRPKENTAGMQAYQGREGLNIANVGRRGLIDQFVSTENLKWA